MNHESLPPDPTMLAQLEQLASGDLPEDARALLLAWLEADAARWRLFGLAALEAQTLSQALGGLGHGDCVRRAELISVVDEVERRGAADVCDRTPDGARPTQPRHPSKHPLGPSAQPQSDRLPPSRRGRRRAAYAAVLAASVVAAFALGFAARGGSSAHSATGAIAGAAAGTAPDGRPRQDGRDDSDRSHAGVGGPILASLRVDTGLSAATTVQVPVRPVHADGAAAPAADAGIADYVRAKWRRQGYDVNVERRYLFANLADGTPIVLPVDQVSLQRVAVPVH